MHTREAFRIIAAMRALDNAGDVSSASRSIRNTSTHSAE